MNAAEPESGLHGSTAAISVPTGVPSPQSSPPPSGRDSDVGVWTALEQHLNSGDYRPMQSPAAVTVPMTTRHGEAYYILANRERGQYARLSPDEFYLWRLMDGTRTVQNLIFEYFAAFHSLAFDVVTQLVAQLRRQFMLADAPEDVFASLRRRLTPRGPAEIASAAWQVVTGQRTFQIRHIDALMGTLHRRGAWILYTRPLQILYILLSVIGVGVFLRQFASGRYDLFQTGGSYGKGLLLLIGLNFGCIVVHEASHALTCKHYGGQVHSAGLMLYFGLPAAFVDTTDIWTKPAAARMATTWAGPYSGAVLAGSAAVIVQALPGFWAAPILFRLSFLWLTTFLFNVIPFLELDGYYLTVDWLEIPLLRARALRFFRTELWDRIRHRRGLTGQERLLAWFGGLSVLFSTLVLLLTLLGWQYRLKPVAAALWAGGLGSKALLVLLFLALGLPFATRGVGQVGAVVAQLRAWTQRLRTPRGHRLQERESLLRQIPCLSMLPEHEAVTISTRMPHHLFRPGQMIVRAGMPADRFYILERGAAEMWVNGETQLRRRLGRGDYFGETALLDREPHVATVRAKSWCSLFSLGRSDFDRVIGPRLCGQVDAQLYTVRALRRIPSFAALPPRQLDALAAIGVRRRFDPGAIVARPGEPTDALYFVETGQAEAVAGEDRRILRPGEHFGSTALTGQDLLAETVRALTALELFELPRAKLDSVVSASLDRLSSDDADGMHDELHRGCCSAGPRVRGL